MLGVQHKDGALCSLARFGGTAQTAERGSTSCREIGWGWLDFDSGAHPSLGLGLLIRGVEAFVQVREGL